MGRNNIIVFDTETTGLSPESGDEMLQLSIIDGDGNVLFDEYLKPQQKTEWTEAMKVNGITPDFVADKKSVSDYIKRIQAIFNSADVIVGYNTQFDIRFVKAVGIEINEQTEIVDVMQDFAEIYGEINEKYGGYKWQKLIKCADYYDFDWSSTGTHAHDSLGDTYATLHCYKKIYEVDEKLGLHIDDEGNYYSSKDFDKMQTERKKEHDNEYGF